MTSSPRRAGGAMRRTGRLLLGRNELRRPSDRIEGATVAFLSAAFLIACVAAALFARHLYESEHAAASSRPAVAALSRPGSVANGLASTVGPRWRLPDRSQRSGIPTTQTAPAVSYAPARTSVPAMLGRSGEPPAPPASPGDLVVNASFAAVILMMVAGVVLVLCYLVCRRALDRHRLARWESAWAAVGPQWTRRR